MSFLVLPRTAAIFCLFCLLAVSSGLSSLAVAQAAPPAAVEPEKVRPEIARLVRQLDSRQFETRRRAADRLGELLARPELGKLLAEEFDRVLLRPEVSFEVRSQLERLRAKLSRKPPRPTDETPASEVEHLVRRLADRSYGVRLGARRRLEWLLSNPKLVCPILVHLKRRLAQSDPTPDARRWLEPIYQQARTAWLLSNPEHDNLPQVSDEQIKRWIDDLVKPVPADGESGQWHAHRVAERELTDLLARDDCLKRVKKPLESRAARNDLNPQAAGRLKKLIDLARPAMVAEFWINRRNSGQQHLLVGVPSQSSGAIRPSHFDHIDERRAHCVSGNSLLPGDYPAGVAFPHPTYPSGFFVLKGLLTPRRRLAYSHEIKIDQATRLARISRRTLGRILADKRPLDEIELMMLGQLDPKELSCFAGKYFAVVDDRPLGEVGRNRTGGRPSRHGLICAQLAADGTNDAVPGLLRAIEQDRFLPPTPLAPYRLHWIAPLSIAGRDPWPGVDRWLAAVAARTDPLVEGRRSGPELGATAAALLVKRHRKQPSEFGLEPADEPLLQTLHVKGYRLTSPEAAKKVQLWWTQQAEH